MFDVEATKKACMHRLFCSWLSSYIFPSVCCV